MFVCLFFVTHSLPLILTYRSIGSQASLGETVSRAELDSIRKKYDIDFKNTRVAEINEFLESLQRDLLFVLRTNNLVRALNFELGGKTVQRFTKQALGASTGVYFKQLNRSWKTNTVSTPPGMYVCHCLFAGWIHVMFIVLTPPSICCCAGYREFPVIGFGDSYEVVVGSHSNACIAVGGRRIEMGVGSVALLLSTATTTTATGFADRGRTPPRLSREPTNSVWINEELTGTGTSH